MRNKIWKKSILMMLPLFLVLPFVNMVTADDFSSSNDSVITSIVVDKLQSDSQLMEDSSGSLINVETSGGEVTLRGMVNSHADITRAGQLAGWVDGVKHVDNRLTEVGAPHYGKMHPKSDCMIGANWAC